MKSLVCKNCGGSVVIDPSAMGAVCEYCGTRFILDKEDSGRFLNFFSDMSAFLYSPKEERDRKRQADELWKKAFRLTFTDKSGTEIEVKYMHSYSENDIDTYVARSSVIIHFKNDGAYLADRFRAITASLSYPSADHHNLSADFPKIQGGFLLNDGSYMLVVNKDEDEYPLRLFGTLDGKHVAWVISRLENICCVLEYNSLVHPIINPDTIYINPYTHKASLLGGWWGAGMKNSPSPIHTEILTTKLNLNGVRTVGANLLGFSRPHEVKPSATIPEALAYFINSTPKQTAYDDFSFWDEMLFRAYGKRKFEVLYTDDKQIYGKK